MINRAEQQSLEELQQQNQKLHEDLARLSAQLKWYEEQFRLAQQKRFGSSSEKTHPDQLEMNLFNEAELLATPAGEEAPMEKVTYERRKQTGKREEDFSKLPVETVTYELGEGDQICACCGGSLHEMSTETRSEIAIVPPQVKVIRHVRQVYACRHCEREERLYFIHMSVIRSNPLSILVVGCQEELGCSINDVGNTSKRIIAILIIVRVRKYALIPFPSSHTSSFFPFDSAFKIRAYHASEPCNDVTLSPLTLLFHCAFRCT